MADLLQEDVVTTAAAARYVAELLHREKCSPTSVYRWMVDGTLARDGSRIYLEHRRLGRQFVTSKQAIQRYALRLADPAKGAQIPQPIDAIQNLRDEGFFS